MAQRLEATAATLPPLRVLHRGTAMVQDYRALTETGTNRKIGLRHDASLGHDELDPQTEKPTGRKLGAFVKLVDNVIPITDPEPYRSEYIKAIQAGDLWAADPETAAAAGVAFEPEFGGEHPGFTDADKACQKVITQRKAQAEAAAKEADAATKAAAAKPAEAEAEQADADAHEADPASHTTT